MVWISNAQVVLADRVLPRGAVRIDGGRIAAIAERPHGFDPVIDAQGQYLLPGLIDMHSDAIEREAMPRPGTVLPASLALTELDKKLAGHGITTIFHSFSLSGGLDLRSDETVVGMIQAVRAFRRSLINNLVHLRYEITNIAGLETAHRLIEEGYVDLLSVMDHTPGQGQYTDPNQYRNYYAKTYGTPPDEIEATIERRRELRQQVDMSGVADLTDFASGRGLKIASHDDDTPAKVASQTNLGVSISEFPITMEAACAARDQGLFVAVGAPNIVRGGSHNGNLGAEEAIAAGWANLLCSDYYPASILLAVCHLVSAGHMDLPSAARLGSLNVAEAVGISDETGSIEVGKRADLILIDWEPGRQPLVTDTMVNGRLVYRVSYEGNVRVGVG